MLGSANFWSFHWLSHSFRVHQIRFWSRLRPGPRWGVYSAPPHLLVGLRGRGWEETAEGKGKGTGGERREGAEEEGRGRSLLMQIPASNPALSGSSLRSECVQCTVYVLRWSQGQLNFDGKLDFSWLCTGEYLVVIVHLVTYHASAVSIVPCVCLSVCLRVRNNSWSSTIVFRVFRLRPFLTRSLL